VGPEPAHAREVVFELCELDLELALGRVRVVSENVEDDRRAIDDRDVQGGLEVSLLTRKQLVVAGHDVCAGTLDLGLQLVELAAAEIAVGIGRRAHLDHLAGGCDPGRAQQLLQLGEDVVAFLRRLRADADRKRSLARAGIANSGFGAVGCCWTSAVRGHPLSLRRPARVTGLAAYWYGLVERSAPCSAAQESAISSSLPKLAWQSSWATT
jgi:hypothetical protein